MLDLPIAKEIKGEWVAFNTGACELALHEFGMMAPTVFKQWGITQSDDFGEIVFNLIEGNLMSKTNNDSKADFQGVVNLDRVLKEGFAIRLDEAD